MMDTLVGERVPFGFRRCQAERLARGMAPRLLDKGYKVTVFDKSAAAVERLREFGASVAASAAEVADSADILAEWRGRRAGRNAA